MLLAVRDVQDADIRTLVEHMTAMNREEMDLLFEDVEVGVQHCVAQSLEVTAIVTPDKGELVAILGVVEDPDFISDHLWPWMLCTTKVERYAFALARTLKQIDAAYGFDGMKQQVYSRNKMGLMLFKVLGFSVVEEDEVYTTVERRS